MLDLISSALAFVSKFKLTIPHRHSSDRKRIPIINLSLFWLMIALMIGAAAFEVGYAPWNNPQPELVAAARTAIVWSCLTSIVAMTCLLAFWIRPTVCYWLEALPLALIPLLIISLIFAQPVGPEIIYGHISGSWVAIPASYAPKGPDRDGAFSVSMSLADGAAAAGREATPVTWRPVDKAVPLASVTRRYISELGPPSPSQMAGLDGLSGNGMTVLWHLGANGMPDIVVRIKGETLVIETDTDNIRTTIGPTTSGNPDYWKSYVLTSQDLLARFMSINDLVKNRTPAGK